MKPITQLRAEVEELSRLQAAATPGPWSQEQQYGFAVKAGDGHTLICDDGSHTAEDAAFIASVHRLADLNRELLAALTEASRDAEKYRAINTPEIHDFIVAVEREALHQRERWGSDHDAGKTDADWFWLVGYLAGKAINKPEKILHHIITTAAACLNWHAHKVGASTAMRPGIGPDKQPPKPAIDTAISAAKEQKP